eukprot:9389570-Alexandrium_andersonii.AAC.1
MSSPPRPMPACAGSATGAGASSASSGCCSGAPTAAAPGDTLGTAPLAPPVPASSTAARSRSAK